MIIKQSETLQFWEGIPTEHEKDYFLLNERVDLYRMWVPGGWLVKEVIGHDELKPALPSTSSICYMPDPNHSWDTSTISNLH